MSRAHIYAFKSASFDGDIDSEEKIEIMRECILEGVDVNYNNSIALFEAIGYGDAKLVNFLIDSGIDIHAKDDYALRRACENGEFEIVKLLLSVGANMNSTKKPLILQTGHIEIIKLLIEHGADPFVNDNKLLLNSIDDLELVKYLISIGVDVIKPNNKPILEIFENKGNIEVKRLLLENDADPNAMKQYATGSINLLECTINIRDIEGCKLLFEFGADINLCYNLINKNYDYFSRSYNRTQEFIDLFMDHGLDISGLIKIEK